MEGTELKRSDTSQDQLLLFLSTTSSFCVLFGKLSSYSPLPWYDRFPADPSALGSETPVPGSLTPSPPISTFKSDVSHWLTGHSSTLSVFICPSPLRRMLREGWDVYFKSGISRACRPVGQSVFRKFPVGWWPQRWEVEVIEKLLPARGLGSLVPDTRCKRDTRAWIPNSIPLSTCIHSTSWRRVILDPPQLAGGRLQRRRSSTCSDERTEGSRRSRFLPQFIFNKKLREESGEKAKSV